MIEYTKIGLWKEASSLQPGPSPVDVGTQLSHAENKNVMTESPEGDAQLSTVTRPDLT